MTPRRPPCSNSLLRTRLYARFADSPDPDPALTAEMARMTLLSLMAANRRKREATKAPQADTS